MANHSSSNTDYWYRHLPNDTVVFEDDWDEYFSESDSGDWREFSLSEKHLDAIEKTIEHLGREKALEMVADIIKIPNNYTNKAYDMALVTMYMA